MKTKSTNSAIFPILFGFFVMGFVDVVGIATNYVKMDFGLSDTLANLLPIGSPCSLSLPVSGWDGTGVGIRWS